MTKADSDSGDNSVRHEVSFSRYYRGPLPPEDTLAGYEKVLPGSADRVFSMVERQQRYEFTDRLLKTSVNLLGLLLIVGLAALFVLLGAPELIAALAAATPTVIAISGGIVTVWRNVRKGHIDRERHKHTLQIETEQHDLDIQIRREQHQLDMQIKRDNHQRALEAGERRLALSDPTEDDTDDRPIDDVDSDQEMTSSL